MFAGLEKGVRDVRTDCTAGLTSMLVPFCGTKAGYTYADDCGSLDGVIEACWLVFSVVGHLGRWQM
jgi:hypothetical protein